MKRKEPAPAPNTGRGRSLISTRTSQQQQRKMHSSSARSLLPRSYSSPASHTDTECQSPQTARKDYVMRSFSSPESKHQEYRRNSESFFRPNTYGSRSELDSDLENFEQFEEYLIDIDADEDEPTSGHYRSSPERDEPMKVVAAMLPGSGLQKVYMRPIAAANQSLYNAREAMKKIQKDDIKDAKPSRLNFRPLMVKMPARHTLQVEDPPSPGVEELQASPHLESECNELERQLDSGEQHLDKGAAIATEESDADTVSVIRNP